MDCSDWSRADCAVDFSPGEVRIGYIRPRLWTDSLIDAAPVTGSLIDSALSDCLIVLCTAGFSSTWTFCSTDFVLLAGFVLSVRRVNDFNHIRTCLRKKIDGVKSDAHTISLVEFMLHFR